MFVQSFRYTFPKQYLASWRRITRLANTIYKEYGDVRMERLIFKDVDKVTIQELAYYPSKKEFIRINKITDQDERLLKLSELLLRFVPKKNIKVEMYDTI